MNNPNSVVLKGHIVTESQILRNHYLRIVNGIIEEIQDEPISSDLPFWDCGDSFILPGFRDQHVHDITGQLSAPEWNDDELKARFRKVTQAFARHGVTGVYLATFGGPLEHLIRYGQVAKQWMDDPQNGHVGASLLGINIEGTFLNDECRGAQPAEYCLIPTRDDCIDAIDRLYQTGAVRLMNIAPDYGKPSLNAIQHARRLGSMVGSGHLKPPADLLRRAFEEYGLQYMVHYTNGPTGQSFKPFGGGGAFEGALSTPIVKELILDRAHIDERYVLDIIKRTEERWGLDKIIAVTDAISPLPEELPDEEFRIGTTIASKAGNGTYLRTVAYEENGSRIDAPPNTLCGSLLTMDKAFSNLVSLFTSDIRGHWFDHSAISLDEAIVKAARLCATHQAMLEGKSDIIGSVTPGKHANLTIGKLTKIDQEFHFGVTNVLVHGNMVFENSK